MISFHSSLLFVLFLFSSSSLFSSCPVPQFHESRYEAGWDLSFSPYSGGEDLLFAHRAIERIEGYFIGKTPLCSSRSASARFSRLSELYFGWLPLNYLAVVVQHEVFGHGYRIRDIGKERAKVEGYSFNAPPPYGGGGAATSYSVSDALTTTEETSIAMGGVESTAILAFLTKLKWLEASRIDPRQSVLYLLGQYDLSLYIGTLKILDDEEGHDIHMYIRSLNYTYTSRFLSKGRLRSLAWINLADPFSYYALFSWFHYISSGKETKIPMIPLFDWGYLPGARLGLTPFGPEIFLENYLIREKQPIYFYGKWGSHSKNFYTGFGCYVPKIGSIQKWVFGFRFDAWIQPQLLLEPGAVPFSEIDFAQQPSKTNPLYPSSEQEKKGSGLAGSAIISYQGRQGFQGEFGYKSRGFLPGYSLRSSPTLRLFYTLVF